LQNHIAKGFYLTAAGRVDGLFERAAFPFFAAKPFDDLNPDQTLHNISGGKEIEIGLLAKKIVEYSASKSRIVVGKNRRWDTKDRLLANIDKADRIIDYKPRMDFDEGLKLTILWIKNNWENIERSATFDPGISSANRDVVKY
jgi:hypothetical protein